VSSVSSWVLLIKTDAEGNKIWWKTFMNQAGEGCNFNVGRSLEQTSDGGYIIAGYVTSYPGMSPAYFGLIIKTDASGNELWSKVYGDPGVPGPFDNETLASEIKQTTSGEYIIAGYTFRKVHLIKMAADGNELWSKTFGEGEGFSVQQTSDGGFVVAGYTEAIAYESDLTLTIRDVYLIKTDADGNEMWSETFDKNESDYGFSVQETTDGGYIIVGRTEFRSPDYQSDIYLIYYKRDPESNGGDGSTEVVSGGGGGGGGGGG
jgi:hypothetical protein